MKAGAVFEGGVLEDQATEITVGSNDVVCLFLLTEFVAVVLGLAPGCAVRGLVASHLAEAMSDGSISELSEELWIGALVKG